MPRTSSPKAVSPLSVSPKLPTNPAQKLRWKKKCSRERTFLKNVLAKIKKAFKRRIDRKGGKVNWTKETPGHFRAVVGGLSYTQVKSSLKGATRFRIHTFDKSPWDAMKKGDAYQGTVMPDLDDEGRYRRAPCKHLVNYGVGQKKKNTGNIVVEVDTTHW
jgi:hypothetical protein